MKPLNPKSIWFAALVFLASRAPQVFANPTGLTVAGGSASAQSSGSQLNVTVSQSAVLNWSSFNIARGETTSFIQPSSDSVVLNVIGGANPSQIYGSLNANGTVILENANGFYFGPDSMIKVGGSFIATTAPTLPDFGSSSAWQFTGMPPLASIVNYGQIEVGQGRSLFLIAENIENHGSLTAPGGNVDLAAGQNVLVSESPDGRGLSATVTLPSGAVDNFGRITADAGTIALQAKVVNQDGVLQANSIQNQNGVIELVASDTVNLGANSQILAQGDNSVGGSAGGNVTIKAGNTFSDTIGSTIATTGGANGGNGGNLEISAPNVASLNSTMDATAQAGWTGGTFFLDPVNIILGTSTAGGAINVNTAFVGFSSIQLQATGNISINANTTWNLSSSTHQNTGQLTLQAGGNITFGNNSKITDANNWSVTLDAGYNFVNNSVQTGSGNIFLNGSSGGTGSGSIQAASGNIILAAGNGIQIGSGAVGATGGNVTLLAGGDITFGKNAKITDANSGSVTLDAGYSFVKNSVQTGSGNIYLNGGNGGTGNGSIQTASGKINLAAGNGIQISSGAFGTTGGDMTLQAGGDITFGNNAKITDANNGSLTLDAGYNFVNSSVQAGSGNIYLNGGSGQSLNGTIQLGSGNVTLAAGQSILVGSGSVFTTGGGSIYADALAGDINCGTANGGYQFSIFGYSPVATLGGISTAHGGDVTLMAGNNVISQPTTLASQTPGASGCYGAGNVTVIAGNQVMGNYTLANGVGTILAGASVVGGTVNILNSGAGIGTEQDPVNLSLISGSWNVYAGGNIHIGEVRNPNGTFNPNRLTVPAGQYVGNLGDSTVPVKSSFLFDYAPNAAVNFWAGNGITLVGANLPRINGQNNNMPPIYAPVLSLNAGAGGVTLENSIILAPSSQGSLTIVTRNGGNLTGSVQGTTLTGIIMSDSGLPGWDTFAQGQATTPLHLNNPNPVTLDISGSIVSFGLNVPTFADITVHGDTYNFGFLGENLSPAQTTTIAVTGNITYRGDLTSESLADPISKSLFNSVLAGDPSASGYLRYDATTGALTYVGVMSSTTEAALLNPVDAKGNPVAFTPAQLIAWQASITALYADSQTATLGDQGLAISGPGHFVISANSIDLGISGGITSLGSDSALVAISPVGADISVTTVGDLAMTSTKIANDSYLGGIMLNIGGTLDVGGQFTTFGDPNAAKGIFTTSGGNVSVTANGDVNVNGSRIAAYNGGNIFVKSVTGDINAGTGGAGYVTLTALQLNKKTGQLESIPASIPGSGILATTVNGSSAQLGNITLECPQGSVNASLGGVLQIAFNGADTRNNFIDITAGKDINANGSGVIGSNIKLSAGGNINGVIIGSQGINVNAGQNVDVTAVSGGNVDIASGGTVSGTIVGGGNVSVSGDSITAAVLGGTVSASGDTSGASLGVPQSNVAKEVAETTDSATATQTASSTDDEEQNKKKGISLAQKVSRVTVVLPGTKKVSERAGLGNPL